MLLLLVFFHNTNITILLLFFKMNRYKVFKLFLQVSNRNISLQSVKSNVLVCNNLMKIPPHRFCSTKEVTNVEEPYGLPVEKIDLTDYGSVLAPKFNFEMIADKSPIIQKYIDLGVNLHEIEKRPQEAQFLVTLTVEKIKPYIQFLKQIGIADDKLGKVITQNPLLFKEDLDDLQVRINYLLSKKFSEEMITTIITRNSKWLLTPVKVIDGRLGFLQEILNLSGDNVRKIIVQAPSLALSHKKKILINLFILKEEFGLDKYDIKRMVVSEASILKAEPQQLVSTWDYLINVMNVSRDLVLKQPTVLTYRTFILKERHGFLKSIGKAQYCKFLPGYVNLTELVQSSDVEFCEKIAKTSVNLYYDFLKTL